MLCATHPLLLGHPLFFAAGFHWPVNGDHRDIPYTGISQSGRQARQARG
jgi:hypothetical protein